MEAYRPGSLDEALEVRAAHPEALPIAGGTDLMVEINFRRLQPAALLDLSRVDELGRWRRANGLLFVGAGMTFSRIEAELTELTALADAARTVGSMHIRNRATIGGNLATASPAGDSIPVLAAYDGSVVVASQRAGTRTVPWHEFFLGPKHTSLAADELITGVEWRETNGPGSFAKAGPRSAMVIAVAAVCVQLQVDCQVVRVALGSVGPKVLRAPEAEAYAGLVYPWNDPGARLSAAQLDEFGSLVASAARPIDDVRGSADYRRHVVERLSRRLLDWTLADRRAA